MVFRHLLITVCFMATVPYVVESANTDAITSENQRTKGTGAVTEGERAKQPENLCEGCTLIRGKVLLNDHDSLLIMDRSTKKEVRLKLDTHTQIGQADPKNATFIEGDRVEAMGTADGRAWSVTLLKHQSNQPGVDAEGD
jgi:hypothetical protein